MRWRDCAWSCVDVCGVFSLISPTEDLMEEGSRKYVFTAARCLFFLWCLTADSFHSSVVSCFGVCICPGNVMFYPNNNKDAHLPVPVLLVFIDVPPHYKRDQEILVSPLKTTCLTSIPEETVFSNYTESWCVKPQFMKGLYSSDTEWTTRTYFHQHQYHNICTSVFIDIIDIVKSFFNNSL